MDQGQRLKPSGLPLALWLGLYSAEAIARWREIATPMLSRGLLGRGCAALLSRASRVAAVCFMMKPQSESRMRENRTSGLMGGEGKRSALQRATAALLVYLVQHVRRNSADPCNKAAFSDRPGLALTRSRTSRLHSHPGKWPMSIRGPSRISPPSWPAASKRERRFPRSTVSSHRLS
jgi:hypothetical protein